MSDLDNDEVQATRKLNGLDDELFKEKKEIEVGEYVRTKDGIIDEVIIQYNGKCNNLNCSEKHISCKYNYYNEKDIAKHRKQPIDLIEEGDLIIYRLRGLKHQGKGFVRIYKDARSGKENLGIDNYSLEQIEIIKILTHEQIEQNCYKVGGEDEC